MPAGFGSDAQGPTPPAPGGSFSGSGGQPYAPPPASYTPPPGVSTGWASQHTPVRLPSYLREIDIATIVMGVGTLLTFIGFLCGAAAAGQFGSGGSVSAFRGWLEAFFVLAGVGLFLVIGGWLFRTVTGRHPMRL
jgi:hypothetical protein